MKWKEHEGPRHRPVCRVVENLEPRDLPSALHGLAVPARAHERGRGAASERSRADASSSAGGNSSSSPNGTLLPGSTQSNLARAVSTSTPTASEVSGRPTPHEGLRDNFTAVLYGPYIIGPPRFSGDISPTYTNSGGVSSAFLHGNLQLGFQTPSAASQGPSGSATLYPKNYLMTGSFLILELQASPTAARNGRATSFIWVVTSASSGLFSKASGSGTLQLIYHGGSRSGGILHAHGWGTANVSSIFRGTLILDGTVNPLRLNSA
jgi:hypothetical protein